MNPNYRKIWDTILSHFYPISVRDLPHFEMAVESEIFVFRGIVPRASPCINLLTSGAPEIPQGKFSEPFAKFCATFFRFDSSSVYQETILNLRNMK